MIESSAAPHSAVRPARPLPPAVRGPRIRPLARPHESRRHDAGGREDGGHDVREHAVREHDAGGRAQGGHAPAGASGHRPAPPRGPARPPGVGAHHPPVAQQAPAPHRSAPPRHPRHPREACAPAARGGPGPGGGTGGERAVRAELAGRFALRLVEVLTGVRPAGQLQRHTTLDGYGGLTALVRSGPLRPRGAATRPRLGRVHDSAPSAEVVEACVRVELGPRHHMVAFRLERHRRTGQWQCAAVEAR
ncbi:Rv3235 family protein [Kitasatospora indigofera]|uniref:Rv3235 family protein n=1 Tax=Kitasatospora indigofera TaxID=67307 RepID=UPI0036BA161F